MANLELDALDGVAQEAVTVFYLFVINEDCVLATINVVVGGNIDGIVLDIVKDYGVMDLKLMDGFEENYLGATT